MPDSSPTAKWHRPEFQGREGELIHLAAAGKLAGVTRAAVTNWARRHADFPELVVETGSAERPTKFIVRAEFDAFLVALKERQRKRGTGSPRGKQRPRATIAADEIVRLTKRITELAAREKKQAAKLENTRSAKLKAEALLKAARESLSVETEAVTVAQEVTVPEAATAAALVDCP